MATSSSIKALYEAQFKSAYQRLNIQQKEAVDTIEGPVLVIAGPGTGKTQIIAARIAHILSAGVDAKPHNILCLTYTDAGAVAMRKRLLDFIGPVAHKVNIYTYHAFCNDVIQHHPQFFLKRDSEAVSDLESAKIYHELLDELPENHRLRRLKGDIYFEMKRLMPLFDLMKREDWSAEKISVAARKRIAELPLLEEFIYKVGNTKKNIKKGDLKKAAIAEETERMETLMDAAQLFDAFNSKMLARARYDFNDMILWVLRAFKENPLLLAEYQERFQYVLVDEFQDTSGSQKELLELLIEFWGQQANVFVVGDDDQSIYEFQGARLNNIVDFYNHFKLSDDPEDTANAIRLIILKENYRSTQKILDAAKAGIDNNAQRLIHLIQSFNLNKTLTASNSNINVPHALAPKVVEYYNTFHEQAAIVTELEALHQKGFNLAEVAVLYSQHKQAEPIIRLLEKKQIPYSVRKKIDLFGVPMVRYFINVLQYLQKESERSFSGDELLFKLMHYPALKIVPVDIAYLSLHLAQKTKDQKLNWRLLLDNGLELATLPLQQVAPIQKFGTNISKWLLEMNQLTLPMLFENIIYDSGLVMHILQSPNRIWDMQVLNTFFDFIKEECSKKPRMHIPEFLKMTEEMQQEKIELAIQRVVASENGVNFITAHSAKGLEFEKVFVIGCTPDFWEKKRGANKMYKLPPELVGDDQANSEEAARRLFYVAITRAKSELQISYPAKDNKDKPLNASAFVEEIRPYCESQKTEVDEATIMDQIKWAFEPEPEVNIELVKKEFIVNRLKNFTMSASALNKYMRCPVAFYYETILQVPSAPNDTLAFGNAVHYALEMLFKEMQTNPGKEFPDCASVLKYFEKSMLKQEDCFTEKQYPRRMELGRKVLTAYYNQYINGFNKLVSVEKMITNVTIENVPIKGKIDKIEFDGNNCTVIDYKTGNPSHSIKDRLAIPDDINPDGGEYWRQMVFYKLLIDNYPFNTWKMVDGIFDFIEPDEEKNAFVRHQVVIREEDVKTVKNQIKTNYDKIMNHEFNKGCNDANCQWCSFVKNNELYKKPNPEEPVTVD